MANEQPRQPRNIFEVINQNVVDLSNDVVAIYEKVDAIYKVLYPEISETDAPGAEEDK